MPTSYSDQFYTFDPANPPASGTAVTFVTYTLTDQNDDGDIDRFNGDTVNGVDITNSYPGDTVTISVTGGGSVTYTGITFYLADGSRVFTPTDNQVLQNGTFISSNFVFPNGPLDVVDLGPPCFAAGTLIETDRGCVPIEEICVGDLVQTLDRGLQPVRWHGTRTVVGTGHLAPIRFAAGEMDTERALFVSPNHKMLVTGWRAEMFFGDSEVLVAAKDLVNHDTICRVPHRHVTYHHLMFDAHEIIFAEGAMSESFFPGQYILEDEELHDEIEAVCPLALTPQTGAWILARPMVKSREATVLCSDRLMAA